MKRAFYEKEMKAKLEKLGFPEEQCKTYFPCVGEMLETAGIRRQYYAKTEKGNAIRVILESIKDTERTLSNVYVVLFDGDGQIPYDPKYSPIFKILTELKNGKEIILGCRGGKYHMGSDRQTIEKFELFLVSSKYGIHLPDGQCGCCGFKAKILDEVALRSQGFEIELDLLTSCLRGKIYPYFSHVQVKPELKSEFDIIDHQRKLIFLTERFQWDRKFVIKKRGEYLENEKLPQDYVNMIETTDWPYIDAREGNLFNPLVPKKKVTPVCLERCETECKCGPEIRLI